ncbi:MAG: hypothetical protein ABI347_07240 [Nitrososphaera sp.]
MTFGELLGIFGEEECCSLVQEYFRFCQQSRWIERAQLSEKWFLTDKGKDILCRLCARRPAP